MEFTNTNMQEIAFVSSDLKEVSNNDKKIVYTLYETLNYKKEQYVNIIGVYDSRDKAIAKMNEDAKRYINNDNNLTLKNAHESHDFEYISLEINQSFTDNKNI